jgi:hypothetical protein
VYGGAEIHLDPIFQPGTSGSQRYLEAKQRVIDLLGLAGEFDDRSTYLLHWEFKDEAAPVGWYRHHFVWGDPHYGNALGKINSCRQKTCHCNVEGKERACKQCARGQNVWWDFFEDLGKILVISKRAIEANEELVADYSYSTA